VFRLAGLLHYFSWSKVVMHSPPEPTAIFRAIFVINAVSNSDWPAATNVGARHLLDMCDNGQQQLCPGVRSGG
ncbi:hypothetical protein QP456_09810, partial [Corynebacterium amycolatum]|uniref:hypothetical protein n=1 Tax=Corynebacterium amycolatum TaxID=43765 RepID=UPI00254EB045